jgi:ribosomal protein S27AE
MSKNKPCPCCGEEVVFVLDQREVCENDTEVDDRWWWKCPNCGSGDMIPNAASILSAKRIWNKK